MRLKTTIRASRKRRADYRTPPAEKRVDLDWNAWFVLQRLAEENKKTLSEMVLAIEDVYVRRWRKVLSRKREERRPS